MLILAIVYCVLVAGGLVVVISRYKQSRMPFIVSVAQREGQDSPAEIAILAWERRWKFFSGIVALGILSVCAGFIIAGHPHVGGTCCILLGGNEVVTFLILQRGVEAKRERLRRREKKIGRPEVK